MTDLLDLSLGGLPAGTRVVAFRASEALSTPYLLEIHVLARDAAGFDPAAPVGEVATLAVRGADGAAHLTLAGTVDAVELVSAVETEVRVRLLVRPALHRLSFGQHSRVWIDKAFPDVLKELLDAGGIRYELHLGASYPTLEHLCQYHESDLDFLSRRMEREGIYYWFEHVEGGEKLHIGDDATGHPSGATATARFFAMPDDGANASVGQALFRFTRRRDVTSQRVRLADYDYQRPTLALRGEAPVPEGKLGLDASFGPNAPSPADATRLATVRAEERAARARCFAGEGSVLGLVPGYTFDLEEHPIDAWNGSYLVTALQHRGADHHLLAQGARHIDPHGEWLGRGEAGVYRVDVEAVRASDAYRPPLRTPVPCVRGYERALVDGPAESEYAQIDEHGRYRVKLLLDENESPAGLASAWVRMLQPHAGAPEGFHFPLRKGTEVFLTFVAGDPDRPLIAGAGPNPQTPSPVTQANYTQNVVQTGGRSRLEIEDRDGSQYIAAYTPPQKSTLHLGAHAGPYQYAHNATLRTDGNMKIHAGSDRHLTVGGELTEDVTGPVTESYHATQSTHVMGAWDETIDGGATQTISGGETRTVSGGVTEDISGGERRDIVGDQSETVSGSVSRDVGASLSDTIGAAVSRTIGGSESQTIGGSLTQTIGGSYNLTTPGAYTVTAAAGATFVCPSFTILAPGGTRSIDQHHAGTGAEHHSHYRNKILLSMVQLETHGVVGELIGTKVDAVLAMLVHASFERRFQPAGHLHGGGATLRAGILSMLSGGLLNWT